MSPAPALASEAMTLDRRRKAAIVVRFLLAEGVAPPLSSLPEETQVHLTREMGHLGVVDRGTLDAVMAEFADHLEAVGMAPPGGMGAALAAVAGHISPGAIARLRAEASMGDPWVPVASLSPAELVPLLTQESVEVAVVALSKLPVARAAEALGLLPGERARRIATAVSRTKGVVPETVLRIGRALAEDYASATPPAFDRSPGERLGAILNSSPTAARDALLGEIEADDRDFAAEVRRAIFTFAHLPRRLKPEDVPRVMRLIDPKALALALASAEKGSEAEVEAVAFVLASVPQRLAESLREEMAGITRFKPADAEAAQAALVAAVRDRAASGEIELRDEEDA